MKLSFAVSALFHDQVLFFVYVFCWKNEYILDSFSRISPAAIQEDPYN